MAEARIHTLITSAWWKRKSTWVVALGGFLAVLLWVVPNWETFWQHVSQFPDLWQIPGNRIIIVYLVIKMLSPIIIMGILITLVWIYSLIRPAPEEVTAGGGLQEEPVRPIISSEEGPTFAPVQSSVPLPLSKASLLSQRAVPNPETPLPAVPLTAEALHNLITPTQSADRHTAIPTTFPLVNEQAPLISIHLLKDVSLAICVPDGERVIVPLTLNSKRVQLLAYIAWRRGEMIDREKILEQIFGWGVSDEDATEEKLAERFESHKKLLRRKLREVIVEQINNPAGRQVIDPDLDLFVNDAGFWGLASICRVDDLEELEQCHKVITLAKKDGKLGGEIPDYVKESCDRIIGAYKGDFLERILKKFPSEFRAWQGRASWVKRPYTLYRDYYLDALWYAAEYEWQQGQKSGDAEDTHTKETNQRRQQEFFGRAAQKYQAYALYACNSRFDSKVTFGAHGELGERIGMGERALRRCVVLLGAIGRTDLVNQVWSSYLTQMKSISDQRWKPSAETISDVEAARSQTNAYRFSAQVAQMSSAFADRTGN